MASEAGPECQSISNNVSKPKLFLACVLTWRASPVRCVVNASREKWKRLELAVKQYLWPYNVFDVIYILKGFLEYKSVFKKANTQQCVFFSPFEFNIHKIGRAHV